MFNWFQNLLMWLCLAGLGGMLVFAFGVSAVPRISSVLALKLRKWRRLGVTAMLLG